MQQETLSKSNVVSLRGHPTADIQAFTPLVSDVTLILSANDLVGEIIGVTSGGHSLEIEQKGIYSNIKKNPNPTNGFQYIKASIVLNSPDALALSKLLESKGFSVQIRPESVYLRIHAARKHPAYER